MATQSDGRRIEATVYNPGPQTYEAELVPRLFRPWAERLVDAAGIADGDRVLDVACGTGIVARTVAERAGQGVSVTGVDVNPAMLEMARQVAGETIEFVEGNAQSLPFDDASFDVVLCQQGLQFFRDRVAALKEMHRVITPGGRVVCAVWRGLDHQPGMELMSRVMAPYLPAEALEGSDAPYWLGDIAEVRGLFRDAGFVAGRIRTHVGDEFRFDTAAGMLMGVTGAHAPLSAAIADLDEEVRAAMFREVEAAFATYADDFGVMVPMTAAIVLAEKQP